MTDQNAIVQLKLLSGGIFFNQDEQPALGEWLDTLSTDQKHDLGVFLKRIHNVDALMQISGWPESPLSDYL